MSRNWLWLLLVAGLIVVIVVWYGRCVFTNCEPPLKTHVTMNLEGGFAYVKVPSVNEVDVSFLKDTHVMEGTTDVCTVHQLGVKLKVTGGTLIQPASEPANGFDVASSIVTIDNATSPPLNANRGSPAGSSPPASDAEWADLKFVASVKDRYGSGTTLRTDWLSQVSGRLKLTRGTLKGVHPTDVFMKKGVWEFKGGAGAPAPFTQAMTNATEYTVDVSGDQVALTLTDAGGSTSQIIVRADASHAVTLLVEGVHDDSSGQIPVDAPIKDFCAFYQLLNPVPPSTAWLIPYWKGDPTVTDPTKKGNATPGGACPGDWNP